VLERSHHRTSVQAPIKEMRGGDGFERFAAQSPPESQKRFAAKTSVRHCKNKRPATATKVGAFPKTGAAWVGCGKTWSEHGFPWPCGPHCRIRITNRHDFPCGARCFTACWAARRSDLEKIWEIMGGIVFTKVNLYLVCAMPQFRYKSRLTGRNQGCILFPKVPVSKILCRFPKNTC
jgi:hypothetical protein